MGGVRGKRRKYHWSSKEKQIHYTGNHGRQDITDEANIFLIRMITAMRKLDSETDSEIARLALAPIPPALKFELIEAVHRKSERRMRRLIRMFGRSKWRWLKHLYMPKSGWRI